MAAASDRFRFLADTVPGRKGEILDAAVAVFADRGYDAGSMREIAERVGITEPAIYRHFASKEELFLALIAAVGVRASSEVGPLLEAAAPDTIAESLTAVFLNRVAAARMFLPIVQTMLLASAHNQIFLRAFRAQVLRPIHERLGLLVPTVDAYYGIASDPTQTAKRVHALISVLVGYFVAALVLGTEADPPTDTIMRVMGWDSAIPPRSS